MKTRALVTRAVSPIAMTCVAVLGSGCEPTTTTDVEVVEAHEAQEEAIEEQAEAIEEQREAVDEAAEEVREEQQEAADEPDTEVEVEIDED